MRKQTGFEFVLLFTMLLQPEEIPLFKYIAHVQFADTSTHTHTKNTHPLPLVLILLFFYHIV